MATVQDVLRVAAGEIGYQAAYDPEAGSKYGRWMAGVTGENWLRGSSRVVWWCDIFVSWVLHTAGLDWSGVFPNYNCDNTIAKARAKGAVLASKYQAQAGDIVFFDWGLDGSADHVGIVEKNCGSYLQTIEGNTSRGIAGSQSAGNGVWRRTRSWNSVKCVIRPPYNGVAVEQPTQPVQVPQKQLLEVDGYWGYGTTKAAQAYFGTPVDGVVSGQLTIWRPNLRAATQGWEFGTSGQGSPMVRALQKWLGVEADGIMGVGTIKALERQFGYNQDGTLELASPTVKAWQRYLNARM